MNTFTQKNPNENEVFSMDFVNNLALNESITSATATITLKSGVTDPDMNTMLVGVPVINGTIVSQSVQGGINGNYYYLQLTANTPNQILVGRAILPVSVEK